MAVDVCSLSHAVKRVYLHTFGCKANQYDTEVLRQALEAAGAVVVSDPADSDAAVINSCTVTHVSEAKMRGLVHRLARLDPPLTEMVVMGCAATLDDGTIRSIQGLTSVVEGTDPADVIQALGLSAGDDDHLLRRFERGTRAWLKIQDGCDEHCTYCATRFARGRSRSRRPDEILREAQGLAAKHAEIVLTGVHIGNYGRERGEGGSLSGLVEELVNGLPAVRFRLSSVEATQIDELLIDIMSGAPENLAPHVHAPLQSGSDRVLKRMGRHWYTADEYVGRLERLAGCVSALGLGADVIVGFPGETDEDFSATRSLVDALPYTYLHVFPYSPRPIAPSTSMRPLVDHATIKSRSAELRAIADRKKTAYRASRSGSLADIVQIRNVGSDNEGLTEDYLSVFTSADTNTPARFWAKLKYADGRLLAEPDAGRE